MTKQCSHRKPLRGFRLNCNFFRSFGESWEDSGLWDDILWLAEGAWHNQSAGDIRTAWHHFVMAVGNFKRHSGRRLHPVRLTEPGWSPHLVERPTKFIVPHDSGHLPVEIDCPPTWKVLKDRLPGAGDATVTTILSALWPGHHHIMDWRVLAATAALMQNAGDPLRLPAKNSPLEVTLDQYEIVRRILKETAENCDLPLHVVERALYNLSRQVPNKKGRSWRQYEHDLRAAANASPVIKDSGSADEEEDVRPGAP